jgi:hypothetical protein
VIKGVHGVGSAGRFLRDAIAGIETVDIVVCGDSNSGFNGGYSRAWNARMVAAGAALYGTGIYPAAQGGSVGAAIGSHTTVGIAAFPGRYTGQTSGVAFLSAGSAEAIAAIDGLWNKNSGAMRPYSGSGTGDYGVDWMYYGSGTNDTTTNFSIEIQAACPTPPAENWIARTGFATFDSGSGYFVNRWTIDASPYTTLAAEKFVTNRSVVGYAVAETEIGANPARTGDIKCSPYNAGGSGGTLFPDSVSAPAGFLFFSAYVRKRGFAVTQIQNYGGATTTTLVDGITGAGGTLRTYLREIRERQLLTGGNPRVIIWLNSGVNGGPAIASNWTDGASDLRDAARAAWASLGYEPTDLAFLFSVSHPKIDPDDMAATRAAAKAWVIDKPDTIVVDLDEMAGYDYLNDNSYFDAGGNQHLTEAGYSAVVDLIIANATEDPMAYRYAPIFCDQQTVPNTTPMTQYTGAPFAGPCIAEISARSASSNAAVDVYVNVEDTITKRFYIESTFKPFRLAVDDLSSLYFQGVSASTIVSIVAYPAGKVVP